MKHIETLVSSDVNEVVIFEPTALSPKEKKIIKEQIKNDCSQKMQDVMDKYVTGDSGIKEISEAANEIVDDIFTREEIVDRVYDIRQRNGDLYDHSIMVASLSIITALKMNLSRWEVYDIGVGSLLHDIFNICYLPRRSLLDENIMLIILLRQFLESSFQIQNDK